MYAMEDGVSVGRTVRAEMYLMYKRANRAYMAFIMFSNAAAYNSHTHIHFVRIGKTANGNVVMISLLWHVLGAYNMHKFVKILR